MTFTGRVRRILPVLLTIPALALAAVVPAGATETATDRQVTTDNDGVADSFSGVVIDPFDNVPISGAVVETWLLDDDLDDGFVVESVVTGADGTFEVLSIPEWEGATNTVVVAHAQGSELAWWANEDGSVVVTNVQYGEYHLLGEIALYPHYEERGTPFVGDWNGDGIDTPGWYLDGRVMLNTLPGFDHDSIAYRFGKLGDHPVAGDFNGDGIDTVSIQRNNRFYISNQHAGGFADSSFHFGQAGDTAFAGDFNGDGYDTIGVRRFSSNYLRNELASGFADESYTYGWAGDTVLVGDFNADGRDTLGIRRGNSYYLRNDHQAGFADVTFQYGLGSDVALIGNFNNDGGDTPMLVRDLQWLLRNSLDGGFAHTVWAFGNPT